MGRVNTSLFLTTKRETYCVELDSTWLFEETLDVVRAGQVTLHSCVTIPGDTVAFIRYEKVYCTYSPCHVTKGIVSTFTGIVYETVHFKDSSKDWSWS